LAAFGDEPCAACPADAADGGVGQTDEMSDVPADPPPRTWSRFSAAAPAGTRLPTDVVSYGADIPTEADYKLLGPVDGKRILDLGCGAGHNAIALARQGAKVIAVDESEEQIAAARDAADREGVKIELHHAPLAELAFVRADTIDGCLSAYGLAATGDLDRVFRQVHRVLRPELALVISLPHPAFAVVDPGNADPLRIRRSYFDPAPIAWSGTDGATPDRPRTLHDLTTSLLRANFRLDTVLEPEPAKGGGRSPHWTEAMRWLPATLILRARKLGI
jgi:SAM-dependent methyltransferase